MQSNGWLLIFHPYTVYGDGISLEAVRTRVWYGQVERVTAHAVYNGRVVHLPVGYLPRQQLPQHHAERPE